MLIDAGKACMQFHDDHVRNVQSARIQCDEIWSFCFCKQKNAPEDAEGKGDVWTWTAIDADTKLVVSWHVGKRNADDAYLFMQDVAGRLKNRVQLTTDGLKAYLDAVEDAFAGQVDFAQLIKIYGGAEGTSQTERKYSPLEVTAAVKTPVLGNPDYKHISTSFVERQNLTMRMHMRRFTRLTNAFSKKFEHHVYAVALHFVYYNFMRVHGTVRGTPAMEAGLTNDFVTFEEIVNLMDEREARERKKRNDADAQEN